MAEDQEFVSPHFAKRDVACRDNCGFATPAPPLLELLEAIRARVGRPLSLSSVCRCPARNAAQGGSPNSAHLRGLAADIRIANSRERFELLKAAFALGVRRIEVASSWVHVDVDEDLPQDVVFLQG